MATVGTDNPQRTRWREQARPTFDTSKLFDRLPPHSIEAEMSLLGSMLLDPAVIGDVLSTIQSGDAFYSTAHAAIFDTLITHYDAHRSGDLVQLAEALRDKGSLEDVGGPQYLMRLAEAVPSAVNAPHYARIVADKAKLRRLIDAAGSIIHDAYHSGEGDPDGARTVLDQAERLIFDVAEEAQTSDAERLSELLHQTIETLEDNEGRTVTGLGSGYYDLDELTSGLQAGEMVIVAARPSMGKTALALNLAEHIALAGDGGRPAPTLVFSLEMSRQAVAQRLLCARSGVDSQRLRRNILTEDDFKRLMGSCGELGDAPLFVDDTPGLSVLQLRAKARRLWRQHDIKCIIVDYLQLLTAPGSARESRQVEVSAISRGIKALARELAVPIVCLSQLNRGAEQREGHRPRMSDLRESGSIEQDADVIMLLHREAYYHQGDPDWLAENPEKEHLAELIVAKQRNGPTGVVELTWDSKTTRFKNHAGAQYSGEHSSSGAARRGGGASAPFNAAPEPDVDDLPI